MIPKELLMQQAAEFGITLTEEMLQKLDCYAQFLVEYNQKVNLTAITAPEDIAKKHFLDSLLLLHAYTPQPGASVIDVGTGAGFPSVPVKIAREDLKLTLLDSLNKRVVFLTELLKKLGLSGEAVHFRAEEAGKNPLYREQYDIATARAVADLRELAEYCLPFVKVGGYFIVLKGYDVEDELSGAQKAIAAMGGKLEDVRKYRVNDEMGRSILLIKKISQTSTKYPRPSAKIAKNPIK